VDYKALLYKMKKLGVESKPAVEPAVAPAPKTMRASGD
jgi:hypothetical protein